MHLAFEIDVSKADEADIALGVFPQHRVRCSPAEELAWVEDKDFFPSLATVGGGRYDRELVFVVRRAFGLYVGAEPSGPESAALGDLYLRAALKDPQIYAVLVVGLLSFVIDFDQ